MNLINQLLLLALSGNPAMGDFQENHLYQSKAATFRIETLAEDLGVPWGMAFLNPSDIIFTEREGKVKILNLETRTITSLTGAPAVRARGQGGLLDVEVPPGYQPGQWIYFTYSKNLDGKGVTTLARAKRNGDRLVEWSDLLVTKSVSDANHHYGSRIAFDGAGHLFFGVGDRGNRPNGQDLLTHAGSILRVNLDGSAPVDNPFHGRKDALPEIWSYGHRNPQGLCFDPETGRLWEIEHGPRGGDEINLIRPGRNYGWPAISYGREYISGLPVGEGTAKPGMEQPVKTYIPSIAPGALAIYRGDAFPGWRGNLFAGALKLLHLNRIVLDDEGRAIGEERLLEDLRERIRDVVTGPDGFLYLSTDSGKILRLRP